MSNTSSLQLFPGVKVESSVRPVTNIARLAHGRGWPLARSSRRAGAHEAKRQDIGPVAIVTSDVVKLRRLRTEEPRGSEMTTKGRDDRGTSKDGRGTEEGGARLDYAAECSFSLVMGALPLFSPTEEPRGMLSAIDARRTPSVISSKPAPPNAISAQCSKWAECASRWTSRHTDQPPAGNIFRCDRHLLVAVPTAMT